MLVYIFWIHVEPRCIDPVLLIVVKVGRKLNSIIMSSCLFIISVFVRGGNVVLSTAELAGFFLNRVFKQRPTKTQIIQRRNYNYRPNSCE